MLLSITNNSIKHQSFLYSQLNDQTVLFLTSLFSTSFVFIQLKCPTLLLDPLGEPYQVLPLWARVDLGVMTMKEYSAFPKATPLLKPYRQVILLLVLDRNT